MKVKKIQFPTKKYTNQTNPRPHSQKEDQKHLSKKEGGGSHNPPMNLKPNDKRNRKTTPSASDSSQKPKQIQEKTPTTHNHIEGGGGGHASESENTAPQRKEPENAPDTTSFIPKGAQMHAQKHPPNKGDAEQ